MSSYLTEISFKSKKKKNSYYLFYFNSSFSLSRNKHGTKINGKLSSGRSQENEML